MASLSATAATHETAAKNLNWAWYLLSQNPATEKPLHTEIANVVKDETPTFEEAGDEVGGFTVPA
ncbi:MAG: cytochrome P450 [Halioglobus sp.]|jgi:cytochrome P450